MTAYIGGQPKIGKPYIQWWQLRALKYEGGLLGEIPKGIKTTTKQGHLWILFRSNFLAFGCQNKTTINIEKISLDDPEVYKLFAKGLTIGVFQFESSGMREFLKKLKLQWRIILAYLLTDEAYAVSIRKFMNEPNNPFLHFHCKEFVFA